MEVIQLLLGAGVDVNKKNMLGMNALLLVSGYGNDQLVDLVIKAGADPNATNDFGHTALHLAVVTPNTPTLHFMIDVLMNIHVLLRAGWQERPAEEVPHRAD